MKEPDSFGGRELLEQNILTSILYIILIRYNDFIYVLIDSYYDFLAQQIGKASLLNKLININIDIDIDNSIKKITIATLVIYFSIINENKNSIYLIIIKFHPFFYVKKPKYFISSEKIKLNIMKKLVVNNKKKQFSIDNIEISDILNINNYNSTQDKYLRIVLYNTKNALFWRNLFEKSLTKGNFIFESQIFESKINCPIRFMSQREIVEAPLIKVQAGQFRTSKKQISNNQIKTFFFSKDVILFLTHIELSKLEILRILLCDIKYYFEKNHFPILELKQVIWLYKESNSLMDKKEIENKAKIKLKTKIKSLKNSFRIYKVIFGFQNKFITLIINFLIMFNLIASINSKSNRFYKSRKLYLLNEIKIKIKGNGTQEIFNSEDYSNNPPSIVLLNGNNVSLDGNQLTNLIEEENNITLIWENKLTNCDYMFRFLDNILEVDLSNFDASEVTSMNYMFSYCDNLISINFGKINTPKLKEIACLFEECISLPYLDLSSFNTSSLINMASLTEYCISLTSINFGNFDISQVTNLNYIFYGCKKLTSLDLSNFNLSSVKYMKSTFRDCSSLTSIDLSNFRTSSVEEMYFLFHGCTNLEYIDISNFDLTKTTRAQYLIQDCTNLKYINLKNFKEGNSTDFTYIFYGASEDFTYCISDIDSNPKITKELKNKSCVINDCSDEWNLKTKKKISEKNICVYNCSEDENYKKEYKNKCFSECPGSTTLSNDNNICSLTCSEYLPFEKNYECISECNITDFFNSICIINYKSINAIEKMVNDISNEIISRTSDSLLINVLNGRPKRDLIIDDDNITYKISSVYNQKNKKDNLNEIIIDFEKCENILKEKNIINSDQTLIIFEMEYSLDEFYIPIIEYEIFHPETKEKIDLTLCNETTVNLYIPVDIEENELYKHDPYSEYYKNDKEKSDYFNENYMSLCEKNCIYKEYNSETKKVFCECKIKNSFTQFSEIKNNKNNLLYHIIQVDTEDSIITDSIDDSNTNTNIDSNLNYETSSLINYENCLFKEKITKKCVEMATFDNLINKEYIPLKNKDSIDKVFEIISEDLEKTNKTKEVIIEGENVIYQITTTESQKNYMINNTYYNVSSIDLGECEKILKSINHIEAPLIIVKVDIKRDDTDSTQVEYQVINPNNYEVLNLHLCKNEDINIYPPVNLDKKTLDLFKYLKAQGYDLFDSNDKFYNDICSLFNSYNDTDVILNDRRKDFYNPNITLCEENCIYKGFNEENLKANCQCNVKTEVISDSDKCKFLPNIIIENFYKLEKYANIKIAICYHQVFNKERLKKNIGSYIMIAVAFLFIISMAINFINISNRINKIIYKLINTIKSCENFIKDGNNRKISDIYIMASKQNKVELETKVNNQNMNFIEKIIMLVPRKKRMEYFNDEELNSLEYDYALNIDYRNYLQFYFSLLKQTQLIIFTFFINDYNLFLLKIALFLISFALFFFMNALFFRDDSLHKIYVDEGKYDFIYQIPKMLYSTIISQAIAFLLEKLSLSQDEILELKELGDIEKIKKGINKIIKCIKIKCILFFIFGICLLFGFWYYISAFCSVYNNTQIPLIEDNFISFLTSMVYPFLFGLLPGIFRIWGLRKHIKCFFIFSTIIIKIQGVLL